MPSVAADIIQHTLSQSGHVGLAHRLSSPRPLVPGVFSNLLGITKPCCKAAQGTSYRSGSNAIRARTALLWPEVNALARGLGLGTSSRFTCLLTPTTDLTGRDPIRALGCAGDAIRRAFDGCYLLHHYRCGFCIRSQDIILTSG